MESTLNDSPTDPWRPEHRLLVRVAVALHEGGAPSYRIEDTIASLGRRLDVETAVFAVPTGITIGLGPTDDQQVRIIRTQPRPPSLERLRLVNDVVHDLAQGRTDPQAGIDRLDAIFARSGRWGPAWIMGAFGVTGLGVARLAGGSIGTIIAAGIASLGVAIVLLILGRAPNRAALGEIAAAFVASFLAAASLPFLHGDTVLIAVAAIIVLVPGLTLTIAMRELAMGHLTAGTARLMGAAKSFVALAFGAGLGEQLGGMLSGGAVLEATLPPLGGFGVLLAVVGAGLGLMILLEESPRMTPWFIAAVLVGWGSIRLAAPVGPPEVSAAVAALVVGLGGNIANRVLGLPAAILVVPGLIVLVPGALGLAGIRAMISDDAVAGLETIIDTALIGGGLVAGLLVATLLVPPKSTL
ncbi:MAG: threonine/serine exporter family protein [Phycisphaera sp.]|nr:threonine/serine exporter family protein [Phycisphaera sp.]